MKAKIKDLSNKEYHADKTSFSSSLIKQMDLPAQARYSMLNQQEYKDCFRIGTAIHTYILEMPKFVNEFIVGIDQPRRSKSDKLIWSRWFDDRGANGEFITSFKAADWYKEFEKSTGKNIITKDELSKIVNMAEAVKNNKIAHSLLKDGMPEQSIFWTDEETGLNLKVRPDYLSSSISDLKSINEVDDKSIWNACNNFKYHISTAMYQDGVMQLTGDYRPFIFIFVSKNAPHFLRCVEMSNAQAEDGHNQYRDNLRKLADCLNKNDWPGYPETIEVIEYPYGRKKEDQLDWD